MSVPLKVLILEDNPGDAGLVLHALEESGFAPESRIVDNEAAYVAALNEAWDIILADYSLPQYTGPRALRQLKQSGLDVPLIVVTGSVNEEVAVDCMRQGASDYLIKDRLGRLGQAVKNALEARATRLQQREAALAALRAKEFAAHIIDSTSDAVVAFDHDFIYTAWNAGAEQITGLLHEQVVGRSAPELYPMFDQAGTRARYEGALAGQDVLATDVPYTIPQTGRHGYLDTHYSPLRNERGEIIGALGICRDTTERHRALEIMRESEERYRQLVELSPDAIFIHCDGKFVFMNSAGLRLFGVTSPADILGRPVLDSIAPEYRDLAASRLAAEVGREYGHSTAPIEQKIMRLDGTLVDVEVQTTAFQFDGKPALQVMLHDITSRKQAEQKIRQQMQRITALHNIDLAITASLDLRVTLNVLLEQVTTLLGVDTAAVMRLNPHLQVLEYAAGRGFHSAALQHTRLPLGDGYGGRAALDRRVICIPDLQTEAGAFDRAPLLKAEGFVTYCAAPLIAKGQVRGVLEVFHRSPLPQDDDWLEFLSVLASQAAIAIDNAALVEELQRSNVKLAMAYDKTIEGWSRALDLRDKETEGHSVRVTELTLRLAEAMGMEHEELVHVRRGALLHDIGKMAIPDSILLKPGPLTDAEWVIMRQHPMHAYELLSPIAFLHPALDIPYCHHEKWDGSGYPRGLRGEQTPLSARIFAVVDVWDALRSDRPYRAGWPTERVLEHIHQSSGSHFDPTVIEAFEQLDKV